MFPSTAPIMVQKWSFGTPLPMQTPKLYEIVLYSIWIVWHADFIYWMLNIDRGRHYAEKHSSGAVTAVVVSCKIGSLHSFVRS